MLRLTFAFAVTVMTLIALPLSAQETGGPSDNSRYTFHRVQDAFLRLDAQTGHVSVCEWTTSGWFCRVVPDERATLESEISRLQDDNLALKKALLAQGLPLPEGIKPDVQVIKKPSGQVRIPGEVEIDRTFGFVGKVWRRMVEMMASLQRDVLRKG